MNHPELKRGVRYRIRYRIPGVHRSVHEFVGTFLGNAQHLGQDVAQFSLRPVSGTSTLQYRYILEHAEVDGSVQHSNPRIVR